MHTQNLALSPPSLEELAKALESPLAVNFEHATSSVAPCPDLREAPFHLATEGLSGDEKIADVGGQPNLFPRPKLDCIWPMREIARAMEMDGDKGSLIGAGAGPFHTVGQNCELSPNFSWRAGFDKVVNKTKYARIGRDTGSVRVEEDSSLDCALMANLYGSLGSPGPVIRVVARKRRGHEKSFTECIRKALRAAYGDSPVSLGGVILIKSGKTHYHIMPDFPAEHELPFENPKQLNDWLTYHDFDDPIMCLSVLHSADPGLGLRMEHTHGFSSVGNDAGGHYHYDVEGCDEEVEYEAYFNTAKMLYRMDRPEFTLDRDLHD